MRQARVVPDGEVPDPGRLAAPWPGRPVRIDGSDSYVRFTPATGPDAEPAAYVHGLGGSGQNWTDLADLLSPWLEGEAIDLPGFGRSGPPRRYGLAQLSDRVVRWLEVAGRGPVHLFGNSLGGAVVVRVAALRPDLVRSLTLISPAMPFLNPTWSVQGRVVPFLWLPGVDRVAVRMLAGLGPTGLARQTLDACLADPAGFPPQRFEEAVAEAARRLDTPWHVEAYLRTFRSLIGGFLRAYLPGSGSLWRLAAGIRAPTLVVWGRQDRLVDARLAPRVARTIPDARLLVVDGVGHVAQMERPRLVARAVRGLLSEVAERSSVAEDSHEE
jgi:pimeloyl-ACP methyl ester carboxylesterase